MKTNKMLKQANRIFFCFFTWSTIVEVFPTQISVSKQFPNPTKNYFLRTHIYIYLWHSKSKFKFMFFLPLDSKHRWVYRQMACSCRQVPQPYCYISRIDVFILWTEENESKKNFKPKRKFIEFSSTETFEQ